MYTVYIGFWPTLTTSHHHKITLKLCNHNTHAKATDGYAWTIGTEEATQEAQC
jgi:hypothetical protein